MVLSTVDAAKGPIDGATRVGGAKGAMAKGAMDGAMCADGAKGAMAKGAMAKGAMAKGAMAKGAMAKGAMDDATRVGGAKCGMGEVTSVGGDTGTTDAALGESAMRCLFSASAACSDDRFWFFSDSTILFCSRWTGDCSGKVRRQMSSNFMERTFP